VSVVNVSIPMLNTSAVWLLNNWMNGFVGLSLNQWPHFWITKMKYNRAFIAAVFEAASNFGTEAAEEVFNKLFDVSTVPFEETVSVPVKTSHELRLELNRKAASGFVYMSDVKQVIREVGIPYEGSPFAVAWIKAYREQAGVGLKEAKDVHDFVRDNPEVLAVE
jgi:hypothetical protein